MQSNINEGDLFLRKLDASPIVVDVIFFLVFIVTVILCVPCCICCAAENNKINTRKRARLAAMREEGNRKAISPDAANSAQAVVHNTEATEAHLILKPVLADDPQTDPSNVIYARTVPPEMPGITCCGDLDMVAPSSNLQSFEIHDNQEDNLERGMEKQVEKFQNTN